MPGKMPSSGLLLSQASLEQDRQGDGEMDKIKFSCPECGTQLSVDSRAAGRNAKYPICKIQT